MSAAPYRLALALALYIAAVAAGCARAPAGDADPAVSEGFIAAADGTRLYVRKVGNGPRAVILPADLFLYPAFQCLAPGRTLVFYDMRNRGKSDSVGVDRENSIQQDVRDLEAVRAHFAMDTTALAEVRRDPWHAGPQRGVWRRPRVGHDVPERAAGHRGGRRALRWADDPDLVFGSIETFLGGSWPERAERVTSLQPSSPPN